MKKILCAVSASILLFSACKKEDAQHNYGTAGPYTSMDNVFSSLAPVARSTSVIVSSGGSVTAAGGTRFIFPANAFMTQSGAAITGSVQVTINDWLKKGDMIFGKVLPVTNEESLESGGQAFVSVTQNGQPVFLKNGKQIQINLPQFGAAVPGMMLFTGKPVIGAANTVQWTAPQLDSSNASRFVVYNGDTISLFSDSIVYCNADRFFTNYSYQNFTIQATSAVGNIEGVYGYALYDNRKGMWPMGTLKWTPDNARVANVPVHLVLMGIKNGDFYAGIMGVTPQTGSTYTINMNKTDPAAFKQQLNGL